MGSVVNMKKRILYTLNYHNNWDYYFFCSFASRTDKPSYLNIKSIPENTPNYLLVHNDLIVEGFSSYFKTSLRTN